MEYVRLGKTNLLASRISFGAMSLQDMQDAELAAQLVRKSYDAGINFFDTARAKRESETLLGDSLHEIRENVIVATKSSASSANELLQDIDESLAAMHVDAIDLYQYEIINFIPQKDGEDRIYQVLAHAKSSGKIQHIGAVTEDFDIAVEIIKGGLYETLQFPFNMISPVETASLVDLCSERDMGFLAMRPLCGGVISNIPLAFGFLHQFENVFPLWSPRSLEELTQLLYFNDHPPVIDESFQEDVAKARMFFN
ncbi:MAG: aldo/keto reductase [Treponema sp.]|nr:aldo/keto reductase [Treponema sp.]